MRTTLAVALIVLVCSNLYLVGSAATTAPERLTSGSGSPLAAEDAGPRTGVSTTVSSASLGYFGLHGHPTLEEKLWSSNLRGKQGPFAVIYVHAAELINGAGYPGAFASFVEALLTEGGNCDKVVVIIGGCRGDSKKMRKAEFGAKRLLREIAEGFGDTSGGDVFSVSTHKDSDDNLAADIQSFLYSTLSTSRVSTFAYTSEAKQPASDAGEGDVSAFAQVYAVSDFFVARFNRNINTASKSGALLRVEDLAAAFNEADAAVAATEVTVDNNNAVAATTDKIRSSLWVTIRPIYRRNIESLYADALNRFEKQSARVPGNSKLRKNLKLKAAECLQEFVEGTKTVRQEFAALLLRTESVLGKGKGKMLSAEIWAAMKATVDCDRLRRELSGRAVDKERILWLQGLYNPYVRDAPWAPTHINFNYLVDPKAIAFGVQYDPFYDEHEEGLYPRRADGIVLPGMSKLRFDPNKHPVPLDNKPWWQTIKEFYFADLEGDDDDE